MPDHYTGKGVDSGADTDQGRDLARGEDMDGVVFILPPPTFLTPCNPKMS